LEIRVEQHKQKLIPGFTARYNVNKLVYFEITNDAYAAVSRERQLKGWKRERKNRLVETINPNWNDLLEVSQWG
jgi:putative endonuclease